MTMREEIVAKVQNLPENVLPEIYETIKKFEGEESNALEKLSKIRISATPDLSVQANLYSMKENAE